MTPPGAGPALNRKQRRSAEKAPSFERAVEAHQAGDLATAERLYRKLLAVEPGNVVALCNLGLIQFHARRFDDAAQLFLKAARIRPDHGPAHANLGAAYRELGRLEAAVQSLGAAVRLNSRDWQSHTNLGLVFRTLAQPQEAKAHLTAALDIEPSALQARFDLAAILAAENAFEAAIEHLTRILDQDPGLVSVWLNLGSAHQGLGRVDEATSCFARALELAPSYTPALYNLAGVLQAQGRNAEAVDRYQEVLTLEPRHVPACINLGLALLHLGRTGEAAACYEEALRTAPENADALCGLADALNLQGRPDEAIQMQQRAARARPDSVSILGGLGAALQAQGRLDEAITQLTEAVRIDGAAVFPAVQLAYTKMKACDWADFEALQRAALDKIAGDRSGNASPFPVLTMDSSPQEQLDVARNWAGKLARSSLPTFEPRPPHGRDRLRIGYLSADFRQHATAFLATGLFEAHDRSSFEVIAYCLNPTDGSADRSRLEAAFDGFVDLTEASHAAAARRIHDDEVDILVDLKGYTGGARTEIMAFRPAPIQVNYLGYPGTMGADFIDYILVDPFVAPPDMATFYSEKLAHVPVSYQPNMNRPLQADQTTRRDHGLPEAGFVFCSFNNSYKITEPVFDVWMRLLAATPGSVLWLLHSNGFATENLKRQASRRGIDPDRLVFAPPAPPAEHLARHRHADLFLDTRPVCAHTTASDALWAGLPLVSCVGESFVSRVSGSLLQALGLPELITETLADYEALALRLARNPDELAQLRGRLWAARTDSGLYDPSSIARRLEAAYREMWRSHRSGEPPAAFSIPR
jgi:predicted O-linked N-acetylglucosamine transferase (SPINDLY family)